MRRVRYLGLLGRASHKGTFGPDRGGGLGIASVRSCGLTREGAMGRTLSIRRVFLCSAVLIGLNTPAAPRAAVALTPHARTTALWVPSIAPFPALPDGATANSATLLSTSCSSPSFCVAVGLVNGGPGGPSFPLVETSTGSTWVASVAPLPYGYFNSGGGNTSGELYSVSCGADGSCAAIGDFQDPNGYQNGLLEAFSGGTWTATEATRVTSYPGGLVNLRSVSCPEAATCVAVGDYSGDIVGALIYMLKAGSWQLEAQPPLPANYAANLGLYSVSCPATTDCVVVGGYEVVPLSV